MQYVSEGTAGESLQSIKQTEFYNGQILKMYSGDHFKEQ